VALLDSWVTTNPKCPDELKKMKRLDAIFLTQRAQPITSGICCRWQKSTSRTIVAIFETAHWIGEHGFGDQVNRWAKWNTTGGRI